jgi:hypothetical protein
MISTRRKARSRLGLSKFNLCRDWQYAVQSSNIEKLISSITPSEDKYWAMQDETEFVPTFLDHLPKENFWSTAIGFEFMQIVELFGIQV